MAKNTNKPKKTNAEVCSDNIKATLEEYNCTLMSADEYSWVLVYDNDTFETAGMRE
jgi:hypothetical protein